ncbi:MAG: aspartate--tRNA(Asn) ligase [Ignisphaera sp.]|uniref:Aspartate--tRNA(Asp/Asn) ligase n=1 Tax=Ignisphaera aggregans TaxID=334771 RepID=A0A7J3MXY4_9CREN
MTSRYKTHRCVDVTKELVGKEIILAGWVHQIRDLGGKKFIVLRDGSGYIQITISKDSVSSDILASIQDLTFETVLQVKGTVKEDPRAPRGVEVVPIQINILNKAISPLPLDVSGKVKADLDTRLRERVLDLRRAEMRAIVMIMNTAIRTIRNVLISKGFVEVFTPKIIATATEGGANLFPVIYFGKEAFLAQSPQLYKELLAASLERVFEIGHAWRAEESDTPYHLSEFISVDIEAAFLDYRDVMSILEELVYTVFKSVEKENAEDLKILRHSLPEVSIPFPRIPYTEALDILRRKGLDIKFGDDLGTPELRILSSEIASPLYFVIEFPTKTRAFYTKPKDSAPELSESFDLIWQHLELASGSSRIHVREMLIEALKSRGLNPDNFQYFIKWFDYGMPPHAGWGLGLARFLLLLTGRTNVKEVTLFPRDKKRLSP